MVWKAITMEVDMFLMTADDFRFEAVDFHCAMLVHLTWE